MKQVTILFMEEDAAFLAAQAGQVDVAYTSATYSEQNIDGYELAAYETVTTGIQSAGGPRRGRMRKADRQEMTSLRMWRCEEPSIWGSTARK